MKVCLWSMMIFMVVACSKATEDKTDNTDSDEKKTSETGQVNADNNLEVPVKLTEASLGALPTINEKGKANPGTLQVSTNLWQSQQVGEAVNDTTIQSLFALECYWDVEKDNACPDAITEGLKNGSIPVYDPSDTSGSFPYWYSNFSILGIIHHAEAYFKYPYEYADEVKKIDPDTLIYRATIDYKGEAVTQGEPGKYLIEIPGIYNAYVEDSGSNSGYKYLAYWPDTLDGRLSAVFFPNKQQKNTSFAQSHLTFEDDNETPRIYAINQVMPYPDNAGEGFRMILIVNYKTDRFLFVSASTNSMGRYDALVAGQGGFDAETSTWKQGYYFARTFFDSSSNWQGCVDSKTQTVVSLDVNASQCASVKGLFDSATAFDPAEFLQLNAQEKTDLVNFLAFFDGQLIEAEQIPNEADVGRHIPDKLEFDEIEQNEDEQNEDEHAED